MRSGEALNAHCFRAKASRSARTIRQSVPTADPGLYGWPTIPHPPSPGSNRRDRLHSHHRRRELDRRSEQKI